LTLSAGSRLGSYEVLSRLGAGGMGEVWRARDTRLDRQVAIKVLPESVAADPEALMRFEREAKAVAALSHPNILAIHDFGTDGSVTYAVTELLEGETLRAMLHAGPISPKQVLNYALQNAKGLAAAHERNIIHRDLKPENLFVGKDGHLKILDFGLAKKVQTVAPGEETSAPTVTGHTTPGTVMGTLGYMSPEQLRGLPVDQRSDIFSFGVVLYEMVTGQRAFKGTSDVAVADAILHAEPRGFGDKSVPSKLKSIIRKLLEKDPAKRYASTGEVHAELKALETSLIAAPSPRLSRNVRIAIAAATVAAAAAAGWVWHRSARARWALETAAPEAARLVEAREFVKAAALAQQARAILPKDSTLEKLWMKATGEATIESVPPGADVSIHPYKEEPESWKDLGKTPLKKIRVPDACFVWRVTKPGFEPIWFLDSPTANWNVKLHPAGNAPPGMVFVPGDETGLGHPLAQAPKVQLDDFFIDQHEVTNEEYKKFVEAEGYQRRELWKQPLVAEGRAVSWEDAIARFRDATGRPGPATWEVGSYPKGMEKHPVAGISWFEAAAYAEFAGKSLPTAYHWTLAAQPGFAAQIVPGSNFQTAGTRAVGGPGALSGFGTTDMAGNVKEWCWNEGREGRRFILAGGFGDPTYMFNQPDAQSPWERKPNYGLRCIKVLSAWPAAAAARIDPPFRDFSKEKPVSEEIVRTYAGLYAYDRSEPNPRLEETETTKDWKREKVSFNAAYGGERVIAHLFLPTNAQPPFQTVVYFPGANARYLDKFDPSSIEENIDFIPKSGRILVFPIYKSTFERQDASNPSPGGRPCFATICSCGPKTWVERSTTFKPDETQTPLSLPTSASVGEGTSRRRSWLSRSGSGWRS